MRKYHLITLIAGVLALGLLAAGCGGSDETSTTVSVDTTTLQTTDTTASETTDTTTTETTDTTSTSGGVDTSAFLDECTKTAQGTAVESIAQQTCQQAADALEQCAGQANNDAAIQACQQVADEAVKQLQAAG